MNGKTGVRAAAATKGILRALALTSAVALGLSACHGRYWDKTEQEVSVRVQDTQQGPRVGLTVKPWIVDNDLPGDSRQPIELEAQVTDSNGRALWTYEAFVAPSICGLEVRDSAGAVLMNEAPNPLNRLDVSPGQLVLTLP